MKFPLSPEEQHIAYEHYLRAVIRFTAYLWHKSGLPKSKIKAILGDLERWRYDDDADKWDYPSIE